MNIKNFDCDRLENLKNFSCDTCVLNSDQRNQLEEVLVENHDLFAEYRFHVGYNIELKIKVRSENPLLVYAQVPLLPSHLRDEFLIQLALLRYFNIIASFVCSNYSSPFFSTQIIW